MKVFNFDPEDFRDEYAKKGFIHIPSGITPGFLEFSQTFAQDALKRERENSLDEWAFKNKKVQFLFDFPETVDFHNDLRKVVATLAGLDHHKVRLCERHIKVYDDKAPENPPPHKDRVASEVTVGIPLKVPENSHIILYPDHYREINAFASTAQHRASLNEDSLPEKLLAGVEPQSLWVWPGDVVVFRGSSMYHERVNPANTSLLYLKFNGMNLDPLAEDPATPLQRERSLEAEKCLDDEALLQAAVMVSPRLEKISRHYSRLYWKELLQLSIWNEQDVSITEFELSLIKALGDDQRRVIDALRRTGLDGAALYTGMQTVRRMVQVGALDLVMSDH